MSDQSTQYKQRFLRDAPPFLDGFERVVGDLILVQKDSSVYLMPITMELVKHIRNHFDECHSMLAKTEESIEMARARNAPDDEIEKLADICRDLQRAQTNLAENVESSVQKILDQVFPR